MHVRILYNASEVRNLHSFFLSFTIHAAASTAGYSMTTTPLCPGDSFVFTFVLSTSDLIAVTVWSGLASQCPSSFPANTITLIQHSTGPLNTTVVQCGNAYAEMTQMNGTNYTSVLIIPAYAAQYLNGNTVFIKDGVTNTSLLNATLNIQLICESMISELQQFPELSEGCSLDMYIMYLTALFQTIHSPHTI